MSLSQTTILVRIYFLKIKDEAFNEFKQFKYQVEIHIENKIKTLQLDNGGEFTSEEFKYLF